MNMRLRSALKAALCLSAILGGVLAAPQKSKAVISPADGIKPVIIFLDGIEPQITGAGDLSFKPRYQNYLIQDLGQKMWGYKPGAADILTVPWDGNLNNTVGLDNYFNLTKALIISTVKKYPNHPIVIVGHSWGSVIGYEVLTALQGSFVSGKRVVDSGSIALFISMGSPLATKSKLVLDAFLRTRSPSGPPISGEQFVDSTRYVITLHKPDTVGYWINYMVKGDRLHGDLVASDQVAAAADENVEFQAATKEIFPWSHNAYFTNGSNASAVQSDAKRILDNDCRNLYTWNSGAPPSGFGAAYGAQLTLKSLIVKATCHGAYRQPLTVEDRSPGVRVVIGSGLSQDKVYQQALVWRNNAWQSVQLNGVGKDPDGYFTGGAWANLPFTASELNPGTRNFVAGYVCENGKCGCVDSACTSHAWQLQAFQR